MSGRIMGIDYGSKRLGVAISDTSATLAQPVAVIERSPSEDGLAGLAKLVDDYEIERIVIGYPRTLSGDVGPQAVVVDDFIKSLRGVFHVPVDRYDERLSSKEARTWLAQMGVRGRKAKGAIDKVAAALVLQSYLDRRARGART